MRIHYVHTRPIDSQEANIIQVLQMCRSFGELGHDVILSAPAHASAKLPGDIIKDKLGISQVPFEVRPYERYTIGGHFKSTGCIPGSLKSINAVQSDLLFVRVAVLLPFVISKHPNVLFEVHNNRLGPLWLSNHFLSPQLVRLARQPQLKAFITISDALGKWWQDCGVPQNKLLALHDGVDLERFSFKQSKEVARASLGLPKEGKIVVYTGSLYKDRGMERILRLARDLKDVQFLIVGGPEARKLELEKQTREQGLRNIGFLGHRPQKEIPTYLAAADVLLMLWSKDVPTINYCSPLKLFEYLAAGRVIVGDGFPTIKEVMKDGEHGYLVDPESYDDLKSALMSALSSPDTGRMAQRAQELAAEYTWKNRCQSILRFSDRN